jgi:dihydrofolate reductase
MIFRIAATRPEERMGKLIYATNTSLDGFTEDATGAFDFTEPDEEVHLFYNDLMRGIGTQLLGRKMYETMAVWETDPSFTEESAILADFAAAWQDSDKLVYSTTLTEPITKRTRIVPAFDADEVRAVKEASPADLLVGGPELAAQALRAGVVDEVSVVLGPVAVGAGKPAFPTDLRLDLELIDERRFGNGAVRVAYRVRL